jgi:valyl-tRNA synthetase
MRAELAVGPVDVALLSSLSELVSVATRAFEDYDYARALERTEAWFWDFCDNYLELVKSRAYGEMGLDRAMSARTALAVSLSTLLRLFAPVMPFVTEEIWSWWQEGSVHRAPWPQPSDVAAIAPAAPISATGTSTAGDGPSQVYTSAVDLLAAVRRTKSDAKVGPRSPVERVTVSGPPEQINALRLVEDDLRAAQNVAELVLKVAGDGETASVDVRLTSS